MANWFEDLTKTMADEKMGRRTAMRHVADTVAGIVAASAMPTLALAKQDKKCKCGQTCSGDCAGCPDNPNQNCNCWGQIDGTLACVCNSFCSQVPTCSKPSDCKKGFACITNNGCTGCGNSYGVCLARCRGKHKNCTLGSGHGLTATGRVV
jgi:hypothetical protein